MQNKKIDIDKKYDISGIEIRPTFDLTWYDMEDSYSEGDIEDSIIEKILKCGIEDYSEEICDEFSWSSYYHLTHLRKNILNWYPFKESASILEIGCGLGAITNMLCSRCEKVTAVELSKRRATATLLRCRDKENLNIIVGNLNNIQFEEKFDYITLIGVLEYQGTYTESDNPYRDFLIKIKNLLKPGGKLLVAIENKYGAKYWCGAKEDHTGMPFDGLNQYELGNKNAKTFSRQELKELLQEGGYNDTFFYYPMSDYKMPTVVYSESYLPKDGNMQNLIPYYALTNDTLVIDEMELYDDLIKNNVYEFFANSFLVECSVEKTVEERVIFSSLSSQRLPNYRIGTAVRSDNKVEKFPLDKCGINHVRQTAENMLNLEKRGLKTEPVAFLNNRLFMNYVQAPTLEEILLDSYKKKEMDTIWRLLDHLIMQIEQSSDIIEDKDNIIYELGIDSYEAGKDYGKVLKLGYLDLIPRNCFVKDDQYLWFDQEWKLDKIPSKYILFRGVQTMYISYPKLGNYVKMQEVAERYDLISYWAYFVRLNELFADTVMDYLHLACAEVFNDSGKDAHISHIAKLLND